MRPKPPYCNELTDPDGRLVSDTDYLARNTLGTQQDQRTMGHVQFGAGGVDVPPPPPIPYEEALKLDDLLIMLEEQDMTPDEEA